MTPVVSTSWAASKVLLSTRGLFLQADCSIATPGSYWLILLDATAAPADGSDVTSGTFGRLLGAKPFRTAAAEESIEADATMPGQATTSGVYVTSGFVVLLSSTPPSSVTAVPSGMWVNGSVG